MTANKTLYFTIVSTLERGSEDHFITRRSFAAARRDLRYPLIPSLAQPWEVRHTVGKAGKRGVEIGTFNNYGTSLVMAVITVA